MIYLLLDSLYYKNVISADSDSDKDMSKFLEDRFLNELRNKRSGFSEDLKESVKELLGMVTVDSDTIDTIISENEN